MSALAGPAYHFRSAAQWALAAVAPIAEPFVLDPNAGEPVGGLGGCGTIRFAVAPALRGAEPEVVLVDRYGDLFADGARGPRIGAATRLVADSERIWALSEGRLFQLDRATLHVLAVRAADELRDVAADGRGGLWLLAGSELLRIGSRVGEPVRVRDLGTPAEAIASVGKRIAVLRRAPDRIDIFAPGGATLTIELAALAGGGWPAGGGIALSAAADHFLVEAWRPGPSGEKRDAQFLLVDPGGNAVGSGSWRDGRAPALLAAAGDDLVALFAERGAERLLRFAGMADPGGERRLTPVLETISPGGSWHRADCEVRLPARATLAMRWAATDDEALRNAVDRRLADARLPMSGRLAAVESLLEGSWSPDFTYVGTAEGNDPPAERLSLPLHEAAGRFLWIDLKLRRASSGGRPATEALTVTHEAHSLMDDLPALYRPDEAGRNLPMRRLVGVLEATTQEIDERIGRLAERLDPSRAPPHALPELAAMLGLPFHDALSIPMQRRLVAAAASILAGRGAEAGLLALLGAIFPDRPIRVEDRTELLVPLTLGGGACATGRALPAMLAGPSARVPRLNARLVLGRSGLCPATACDDPLIAPAPEVLVSVPATGGERRRYASAVRELAEAMIPAGVRLRLRWTAWRLRTGALPPDLMTVVDSPEALAVGFGGALGRARIGGRRDARIDRGGDVPLRQRLL
jgi:phage tail-like protein